MFDRFDVLNAYYVFATLHHSGQGSAVYGYLGRLARMGYKPGLQAQKCRLLDPGARRVYRDLCIAHNV